MNKRLCWKNTDSPSGFAVALHQFGRDSFQVTYGKMVTRRLSYIAAAGELGAALMHRAACDGKLDNRSVGEK